MPVTATHLTTAQASASDSHNTASISPGANKLILVFIRVGSDSVTIDSVTGNGITYAEVVFDAEPGGNSIACYRGMSSSPTTGAITIDFSGSAIGAWSVVEFDNVDTTGVNGANAVVQNATNVDTSATSLTVTLGAFSSADNATAGMIYYAASALNTLSVGSGFTELGNVSQSGIGGIISEWKDTNDTTVDASQDGAATYMMGVAVEIKFSTGVVGNNLLAQMI
jgi:hypothetical protein